MVYSVSLAILFCITGCKTLISEVVARKDIAQTLQVQADAWNAGDIEEFMQTYWKSQLLTFSSGGSVRRGWQATLDNYKQRYPEKLANL